MQVSDEAREAAWECFQDASHFDMWCVRLKSDRAFGAGFHLVHQNEAEGLRDLLNEARRLLNAHSYDEYRRRLMGWQPIETAPRDGTDIQIIRADRWLCPVPAYYVSEEYLESMVGKRSYGTMDVLFYPIFQALGLNWWGTHCSEAINDDLWFHGYRTPWVPYGAPPSPADLLHWLEKK
jgi:hypothetical protein